MWQRIWVFAGEAGCGTKGSGSSKDQTGSRSKLAAKLN
jgi:hypothetical protein